MAQLHFLNVALAAAASAPRGSPRMNVTAQQTEFLSWKILPARLDATQTAWYLGFEPHEIPMLIAASLLKPLGRPARNSTKFFATESLEQLRRDEKWLARASDGIAIYWREKNARRTNAALGVSATPNGLRIPSLRVIAVFCRSSGRAISR